MTLAAKPARTSSHINRFRGANNPLIYSMVCAFDRAKMLAGQAFTSPVCFNTLSPISLCPQPLYFLPTLMGRRFHPPEPPTTWSPCLRERAPTAHGAQTLDLWKLDVNWSGTSTFTGPSPIAVDQFTTLPSQIPSIVPEQGGNQLNAIGDRVMNRLVLPQLPGAAGQRLLGCHAQPSTSTQPRGERAGVRWYELRVPSPYGAPWPDPPNSKPAPTRQQDPVG